MRNLYFFDNFNRKEISPDFVPHEDFHNYRWVSSGPGNWYYKIPHKADPKIPKNPRDFLKTLDKELIAPVSYLHSLNVPTTPSCSGHFNDPKEYEKIYHSLQNEEKKIRSIGVEFKDPEDDSKFFLKNKKYELPWERDPFVERSVEHSKFGVLGIHDPKDIFYNKILNGNIQNSQLIKNGELTIFLTSPANDSERLKCWKKFNDCLVN